MTASLSGQAANMPGTNRTSRLGENNAATSRMGIDEQYGQSKTLGSNLSTTTNGWNVSGIWGNGALGGSSFGSASRERSRNRESGAFSGGVSEVIEGKTGSGSLLASSETDTWTRRSPWGSDANATRRSSGVSPARQRPSQPYMDSSQSTNHFVSNNRTGLSTNEAVSRSASLQLDVSPANIANYSSDAFLNGYAGFDRVPGNPHRASDSMFTNTWTECQGHTSHSPSDDRRSVSEYFANSSAAASRSGSLPPSRHGADPAQLTQMTETMARLPQSQAGPGSRGHASSLSSHSSRAFPERTNSFPNEAVPMFNRLSLEGGVQPLNLYHRPTASNVSALALLAQQDQRFSRQSMSEQALDDGVMGVQESFTPEGYPYNQQVQDALNAYNMGRLADRGGITPGDSDYRASPFYSTGGTPPVFDHLYPSRSNQSRASPSGHPAILERKLRDLQQGQQAAFLNTPYSQMFQLPQYRGQFNPYQYAAPNAMQFNGIAPTLQVSSVPPIVAIEAPRGPKEHDAGQGLRSALLEEFKSNNKGSRRYELKDIYDHVVEFSGDQHGSRFIQQKLETANSDEKERVFREIQTNSMQLMQDVFGNYVIQKFFEHGDQSQKKVLANRMKGQVLNLSLQMYGCRVVQKALEHILTDQQASLVKELEHSVLRCVKDQNGNHVIQKAIERVPAEHIQFIIQAFTGQVAALATHPYGCRVIQRMLEHCEDDARNSILQELHACGTNLISDQYGNYVTQHIIEHGRPEDRAKIIDLVKSYLLNFSKHKFASNVVEKCLVFGSEEQRREIMLKVVEKPEGPGPKESNALALIKDNYGNYVIQKLLDVLSPADHQTLVDALTPELLKAKRTVAGKQVLAVEKKMHRFDKKIDSPLEVPARMSTQNESTSPTVPIIDTSVAATPPPPLTADAQSLRSDSIPSTTMSAVDEPVTGMMPAIGKPPGVVVPHIGVTETTD